MVDEQTAEAKAPEGFEVDFVREFMTQRQGKWFVAYAGLLHLAHERGLVGIEVNILQFPSEENGQTCICRADVRLEGSGKAHTFSEIGDANAGNVGKQMIPHIIRMAATRAKSRALRDAVDIGVTALEELADADEGQSNGQPQVRQGQPQPREQQAQARPQAQPQANGAAGKPLDDMIDLEIDGKTWRVPAGYAQLSEQQIEEHKTWVRKITATKNAEQLDGVLDDLKGARAMQPEIVHGKLVGIVGAWRKKLTEGAANGHK